MRIRLLYAIFFVFFISFVAEAAGPLSILNKKEELENKAEQGARKSNVIQLSSAKSKAKIIVKKLPVTTPKKRNIPAAPKSLIQKKTETSNDVDGGEPKRLVPKSLQGNSVIAKIEQNLARTLITFLWDQPVKAAVFNNNGKLWVIFDSFADVRFLDESQQFLASDQHMNENIAVYNMMQKKLNHYSTFVVSDIKVPEDDDGYNINAYQKENNWIIEIAKSSPKFSKVKIDTKFPQNALPHIEMNIGEVFQDSIEYQDPFTNQMMSVIPLYHDRLVKNRREFVDLNILETLQGVAIERISEGISLNKLGDKCIDIIKKTGLNISPEIYLVQHEDYTQNILRSSADAILNPILFEFPEESFEIVEKKLLQNILLAAPSLKSRMRLELAMFYFASGFYNEAYTMLRYAKKNDRLLEAKYQVQLLSAVLQFFNKHYDEAINEMSAIDIKDIPHYHLSEFRFWQSVIAYSNIYNIEYISFSNASKIFTNLNNNFLQHYTKRMKQEIGLIILEYKVHNRILSDVKQIINVIKSDFAGGLDDVSRNRFHYNMGRYFYYKNDIKSAVHYFNLCMNGFEDGTHYNKCYYDRSVALYDAKLIDKHQLIESIERVKMRWKGGQFELEFLDHLYHLYLSENNIIDALRTGQAILDNYEGTLDAVTMNNNMSRAFIEFFLNKEGAKYKPIDALEVFFEFQQLLPIGKVGDEIILRVADYLAELDLLDRYITLLEHQVKNRLTGLKKERAINKLANAYLKNLQPLDAINIIKNAAHNTELPYNMIKKRKYIIAQALYKLGKDRDVLELLNNEKTKEADDIRSDIFWQKKDWMNFNDFSEPYLYSIRNKKFILTDDDAKRILRQMISYMYIREYDLLEALYDDFKDRILDNNKYLKSIQLLLNIALVQKFKDKNNLAFDAEEIYRLTSDMVTSLNNS